MNDRRRALIEILALLEKEGWAEPEAFSRPETKTVVENAFSGTNPILAIICAIAVATNFILIGANHDMRQGRAIVKVADVDLTIEERLPEAQVLLQSQLLTVFITVNGVPAWEAKPHEDSYRRVEGKLSPTWVSIETMGLLQFWGKSPNGRAYLLGQANISPTLTDGSTVRVETVYSQEFPREFDFAFQLFVKLRIDKTLGPSVTYSRATPRK